MVASADPTEGFVLLALCFIVYFLPTAIGLKKRSSNAIFALNLLLGWTLLGWVIALVWALSADPPETIIVARPARKRPPPILCAACGKYSAPGAKFCSACGGQFV
jgi:Superinfection immunity protein